MKEYKIKEEKDLDFLKKEKLQETSFMVNTVQDAQETIAKCIKIIMKKKAMNTTTSADFIANGIISGIDSANEVFPKVPGEIIDKKKLSLSKKIKGILSSYIITK